MTDVAALIADMVRAGVDPDIIGRTAAALAQNVQVMKDPVADRRRAYDRERKALAKASLSTGIPPESADSAERVSPKKETSPTPPKEKTTPSHSPSSASAFAQFWAIYPNRVGKRDAESAFSRALTRSDLPTILAGLRRYAAKTDDRPWCNPATWLNQGRWDDEPAASTPQQRGGAPPAETVGSLSKRQLFEKRQFPNAPDDPTGRVVQIDARRLEESSGNPLAFAIPGNIFGRF